MPHKLVATFISFLTLSGAQTLSPSPSQSASSSQLPSPSCTNSPSQLLPSPSSSGSPSQTSSASPSQSRSPAPSFCDAVINGTCVISSWKIGDNCTGQGSIFNITEDSAPQDFDQCTLAFDGGLRILPNASLSCALPEVCVLTISVTGSVVLDSTSFIEANTVIINASFLSVASGAWVSAAGLGFLYGPGSGSIALRGSGGSFGGSGGRVPCARRAASRRNSDMTGGAYFPASGRLLQVGLGAEECCDGSVYFSNANQSIGSWADPLWTGYAAAGMGSGGGIPGAGRGGGRILVRVAQLVVDGDVSADGGLPVNTSDAAGGAGSGGSIDVSATTISGTGAIHANGGDAGSTWAAGGGGRISATFLANTMINIVAHGGRLAGGSPSMSECMNGAAGTVVLNAYTGVSAAPIYTEVKVANVYAALAVTLLTVVSPGGGWDLTVTTAASSGANPDTSAGVDAVLLQSYAVVATEGLVLRRSFQVYGGAGFSPPYVGLLMSSRSSLLPFVLADVGDAPVVGPEDKSRVPPRSPTSPNLTISAAEIELSSSYITTDATAVFLESDNMTLGPGSTLSFDGLFTVRSNNTIYMDGQALPRSSYGVPRSLRSRAIGITGTPTSELQIWAGSKVFIDPNCDFVAEILGVYSSNNITVTGRLENSLAATVIDQICTMPVTRRESCSDTKWLGDTAVPPISNYTLVLSGSLTSGYLLIDNNGLVVGNIAQICGLSVEILGSLSANYKGCGTNVGPGRGYYTAGAGSGGGHGGAGGASSTGDSPGLPYDSVSLPVYPGSGGGSEVDEAASAGGYIVIEAPLALAAQSSEVTADGTEPSAPAGGGAGGAILLVTNQLLGYGGTFSVKGGDGYTGGGGGGGGIISLQPSSSGSSAVIFEAVNDLSFAVASRLGVSHRRFLSSAPLRSPRLASFDPLPWLLHMLCEDLGGLATNCFGSSAASGYVFQAVASWAQLSSNFLGLLDTMDVKAEIRSPALPFVLAFARKTAADASAIFASCAASAAGEIDAGSLLQSSAYGPLPRWLADCAQPLGNSNATGRGLTLHVGDPDLALLARSVSHLRMLWETAMPTNAAASGGEIAQNFFGTFQINGGASDGLPPAGPGGDGTLMAPRCPAGLGGLPRCTDCGVGYWRNNSFDAPFFCLPCYDKPAYGYYTDARATGPECAYACPAGYLYPRCRTPLEEAASVFGGLSGFVSFIAAIILLILVVLLWLYQRRAFAAAALKRSAIGADQRSARQLQSCSCCRSYEDTGDDDYFSRQASSRLLGKGSATYGLAAGGDERFSLGRIRSSSFSAMAAALAILRRGKRGGCCWGYARDKSTVDFLISSTALQEADLSRHVHRVYFSGFNTFGSPWRLPNELPTHARRYVRWRQYRALCDGLNAELAWPEWGWERVLHLICSIAFPPAGSYLHRWQRRQRVWHAMTRLLASGESHRWLKGTRAAALQDNIRVGITADFSLAYVDLLRSSTGRAVTASARGSRGSAAARKPAAPPTAVATTAPVAVRLPLAFMFAGDGSFEFPFHLDPNDILLRAVPSAAGLSRFIDDEWVDFVAEVNNFARCIISGATIQTLGPLLAFVSAVNAAAAGQDGGVLGGLHVDVVRFWPEERTTATLRHTKRARVQLRGGVGALTGSSEVPSAPSPGRRRSIAAAAIAAAPPPAAPVPLSGVSSSQTAYQSESSASSSSGDSDTGSASTASSSGHRRRGGGGGEPVAPPPPGGAAPEKAQSSWVRKMSVAVVAEGADEDPRVTGATAALQAEAVRSAPSLDGFRRGSRASFAAGRKGSTDGSSDGYEGKAEPDGDTVAMTAEDDADDDEEDCAAIGATAASTNPAHLSSLEALAEDAICVNGARLGLLISLANAPAGGAATVSPLLAAATARGRGQPEPKNTQPGLSSRPAGSALAPFTSRQRAFIDDDAFQFGLDDEGVAVVPSARNGHAALWQDSNYARAHAAFNLDADLMGPALSASTGSGGAHGPLASDGLRLGTLLDLDAGDEVKRGEGLTPGSALRARAPPTYLSAGGGAVSVPAALLPPVAPLSHTGHDWQRGPVVVAEARAAKPSGGVATARSRFASRDDSRRHAASRASSVSDAMFDEEGEDDAQAAPSLWKCLLGTLGTFSACFSVLLSACGTLLRALDPALVLDIGGDDDALGTRIDMRLPYAGLPVAAVAHWSWQERARLGSLLLQPRRSLLCNCCGGSKRHGRRRHFHDSRGAASHHGRGRGSSATSDHFRVAVGRASPHNDVSADASPVLAAAQATAALWLTRARRHLKRQQRLARQIPGGQQFIARDSSFSYQLDDGHHANSAAAAAAATAAPPLQLDGFGDEGLSSSSDSSASSSGDDTLAPPPTARAAAAGHRLARSGGGGGGRSRRESFHSDGSSGSLRRVKRLHPYAVPAPRSTYWAGGVTCAALCSGGARLCCRRVAFVLARICKRPSLPSFQPAEVRSSLWFAVSLTHVVLMVVEVSLVLLLVAELWCIEQPPPGAFASGAPAPHLIVDVAGQECNVAPLVLYALLPPGACILPPLLGLGAVALQSSRALRLYARWNAVALWTAGIALGLALYFVTVLGLRVLTLPVALLVVKLAAAQCVGVQLSEIERSRPIRGWRGLFEVRTGPVERCANADVKTAR